MRDKGGWGNIQMVQQKGGVRRPPGPKFLMNI